MFEEYFEQLGLSRVVCERVESLYASYIRAVDAARVPSIFVENTIEADGTRVWGSLWIYGPDYAGEVKNFQTETRFDGFNFKHPITRWECTLENYEIGDAATTNSRFLLYWNAEGISGKMPATGMNCEQLSHFFTSVIVPHDAA